MTANNTVDRITERFNIFEKKISNEIRNIKNDMDSHFLSLEQRLIKIEVEHDYLFYKLKFKQQILNKFKSEFLEFSYFIFGILIMVFFVYFHIIN